MLQIEKKERILLFSQPVDLRNRFDGLVRIIREKMFCDPDNGFIYVFINKRKNTVAMLRCEDDGIAIYTKRLEPGGVYERPLLDIKNNATLINESVLMFIINGAVGNIQFRKRYSQKQRLCA